MSILQYLFDCTQIIVTKKKIYRLTCSTERVYIFVSTNYRHSCCTVYLNESCRTIDLAHKVLNRTSTSEYTVKGLLSHPVDMKQQSLPPALNKLLATLRKIFMSRRIRRPTKAIHRSYQFSLAPTPLTSFESESTAVQIRSIRFAFIAPIWHVRSIVESRLGRRTEQPLAATRNKRNKRGRGVCVTLLYMYVHTGACKQ